MLAAVGAGDATLSDVAQMVTVDRRFQPSMAEEARREHLERWAEAVQRVRSGPDKSV